MNVAHKNYRPDIDGLRAIAILAVLFYHFLQNSMPGGFVGVDIFFVISGYLITKNILNEIHQQKFTICEFYKRRIIRIFPALTATLLFCFFVGEFILPVNDNKELQKHIIAGVLFLSNYLLPWESGYFEIAMTKKPLMHLWSLAIEEQFYIIWPLMVVCIFKFRHKIKIIYLLALLSLCYNIYLLNESVVFGYFSAFARFWELLAGAILAHREIDKATNSEKYSQRKIGNYIKKITGLTIKTINDSKSVYGIVLIALSCYFRISLDVNLYAPFAVIGAYLLISAGNGAVVNRFLLSAKPMVFIGLISYPLYLWHWPLLSIYRIEFGEYISLPGNVALIILSFLLSYFTYKFIEIPIRFGVKISKECRVGALLGVMVIICMAAAYSYYNNGAPLSKNSKTEFQTSFENAPPVYSYYKRNNIYRLYRAECNFYDDVKLVARKNIESSCYQSNNKKEILLWGDSHAEHLYYGLNKYLGDKAAVLQVDSSGCNPSLTKLAEDAFGACNKANEFALQVMRERQPKVVIIAQRADHEGTDFAEMAKYIKSLGVKQVILLGPIPQWNDDLYSIYAKNYWDATPKRLKNELKPETIKTENTLKARYENSPDITYISAFAYFCNEEGCLTHYGDDVQASLTSYDYGHFTPYTSEKFGEEILGPVVAGMLGD